MKLLRILERSKTRSDLESSTPSLYNHSQCMNIECQTQKAYITDGVLILSQLSSIIETIGRRGLKYRFSESSLQYQSKN